MNETISAVLCSDCGEQWRTCYCDDSDAGLTMVRGGGISTVILPPRQDTLPLLDSPRLRQATATDHTGRLLAELREHEHRAEVSAMVLRCSMFFVMGAYLGVLHLAAIMWLLS